MREEGGRAVVLSRATSLGSHLLTSNTDRRKTTTANIEFLISFLWRCDHNINSSKYLQTYSYPIILIGEYEREPCYSYEEAKEILQRDGNRPMEIHTLVGMELIDGMLAEDPAQRWDLREINAHEFVTGAPEISEGDVLKALEELKEETKNSNRGNNSSVKSYIKFRGGAKGKSDEPPFFTVPVRKALKNRIYEYTQITNMPRPGLMNKWKCLPTIHLQRQR